MEGTVSAPRTRTWSGTDLLMLGAVTIWGINFTVVKVALRELQPMSFLALRFTLATVVILAVLWLQSRQPGSDETFAIRRGGWLPVIGLGLIGHTLYQVLFVNGLALSTPSNASLVLATAPIWVALIGLLLRVERINRMMWIGILLSFAGIAVLMGGGASRLHFGGGSLRGDLLLFGCAIMWATYTTLSKPLLLKHSPLKLTAWTMAAGTVPMVFLSIPALREQDWRAISPLVWGAIAYSALLALTVGYVIWYASVRRVGNARTAVYSNLTPVIAILFAWVAVGDRLSAAQWAGAVVVFAGLFVTKRGRAATQRMGNG